mgnify:CR=1 FL=1
MFQISVTNDIRFYGLLKTIGTTPRQLRRIIRIQALLLSLVGIPLGLLLGWLLELPSTGSSILISISFHSVGRRAHSDYRHYRPDNCLFCNLSFTLKYTLVKISC